MKNQFLLSVMLLLLVSNFLAQNKKLDSLLVLLKTNKEDTNKVNDLRQIGIIYKNRSAFDTALQFYNKSVWLGQKLNFKKGTAKAYNNIGSLYNTQANYPKAIEYFFKALKLNEETGNKIGIGKCYNNIGAVYDVQNNYTKALIYFLKDLKICEELKDKKGIASSYVNVAGIYYCQSNYPKALNYYFKALKLNEETKNKNGIANCYSGIGNVYLCQAKTQSSLDFYLKGIKIYEEVNNENEIARVYTCIATLYYDLGKYTFSVLYADSAMKISQKIGGIDNERLSCALLAKSYSKIGKYQKAYENHVKFKILTDSIFNAENSKQLGDLKTNFEVEKKEAELKLKAEAQELITAEEKKRQQLIIYAVAGVLIIVVAFSGLLYKRFRVTQKQKNIIELKEKETQQQNVIISEQKYLIEERHKEITDSINYAERIQRSFLATEKQLNDNLKEYFVLFKPKDVVSGDFYWGATLNNNQFALVTADSTGHGVPGAIMSLLNITSLEKAIETEIEPSKILDVTRKIIIDRLKKDGSAEGGKDGMDCSVCVFDFENKKLIVSAAHNPVWIVRAKETIEIKPDKMPVGKHDKDQTPFTHHEIELHSGDVIYTLTDGFPDQFGGEKGKKFMSKNLRELLANNAYLPMHEQRQLLETTFNSWKQDLEQVDDVTIIGIKI